MADSLLVEDKGAVRSLVLNRPDKRNALNDALVTALKTAIAAAHRDAAVKAVIVRGAGSDFCSGADLSALKAISEASVLENLADAESLMELFQLIRYARMPVIAAVQGRALAGGCGLATACDVVLASQNARFGYPEVKIGFVPAIVMAILRRNLSEKRAFEMITTGAEISAERAEAIGLVNHVFEDEGFDDGVKEFAGMYERMSASAVELSKKLFYQIDAAGFDASLRTGAEVNTIARMTEDCQKGIARFLDPKPR